MLTATKGLAVMNTVFKEYGEWVGDITMRENGSLVSFETGQSTAYALESIQARGKLFIRPGLEIYRGQVIGVYQRQGDLEVNACKRKAATNIRRSEPLQASSFEEQGWTAQDLSPTTSNTTVRLAIGV